MKAQGVDSLSEDKTRSYWRLIAEYCLEQGYQLATRIELPSLLRTEDVLIRKSTLLLPCESNQSVSTPGP